MSNPHYGGARRAIAALLFLAAPAPAQNKNNTTLHLTVGGIPDGGSLPPRFTCDGKNISPPLSWSGEPEGTQSFALIVEDPDARNFNHWLLWDIPASVHALAEGAKPEGVSGTNDFGDHAYGGPCPPAGTHRYVLRLFAVDAASINLKEGKGRDALDNALRKHVLAKVEYRLQYGRR
jgi:Raf kinase inhibitor-like YbhB/YbcL family protein